MSTIKDVAKRANVSVTTVSRVLNNNGYVHQDTKKIIEDAMNELKYSPNTFAQGLSTGTTNTIGLIINHITDSNSSKLVDMLESECNKKRIKTLIGITRKSDAMEQYYFNLFKKYNVDGIIIANKLNNIDDFISLNKPIVTIDHTIDENTSSIKVDYNQGINLILNNFINDNRKNIIILDYKNKYNDNIDRLITILNDNNITTNVIELEEDFNKDYLQDELSKYNFDGIYTTCDIIAISLISVLHKLRIKVPDMCSIIGSSNTSFSSIISPALTSIAYPAEKICSTAFELLYNNITNNEHKTIHEVIETNLIKRETTK